MTLDDLPTPSLVLDRTILKRNLIAMSDRARQLGVTLRPHMKTAKSADVARLATAGEAGGITVSTLAEAEYFAANGFPDMVYAAGITPRRLARVIALNAGGARIQVITDDLEMAALIGASPAPPRTLIEIDTGEHRGGLAPNSAALPEVAARLGPALAGVLTHGGHSYGARGAAAMAAVAEAERTGAVGAAERLRAAGHVCPVVSVGSTPTARHAVTLDGVTEIRPGVYMFGDLFQAGIGSVDAADLALTVLSSVIGRRVAERRYLLDAGSLALSKDRSTAECGRDHGFGLVLNGAGLPVWGETVVERAYQEHGVVRLADGVADPGFAIGDTVRIAPNHACLTAAAHDRYHVVEGGREVVAVWPRVNGW